MRPRFPLLLVLLALSSTLLAAEIPLAEPGIVPASSSTNKRYASIVAAGDGAFLVAWEERTFGIHPGPLFMRVYDRFGRPRTPAAVLVDAAGGPPHAIWNGTEFLLVYSRQTRFGSRPAADPIILALRVRTDGTIVEGSTVPLISDSGAPSVQAMAWNGEYAAVVVTYGNTSRLLLLEPSGRVVRNEPLEAPVPAALAGDGNGFFRLTLAEGDAVATNGTTFAAIDNTSVGLVVTFMDRNHKVLDGFVLAPNGRSARSIAWDGSNWLTAYLENGAVCTARFTNEDDVVRSCNSDTNAMPPFLAARDGRSFTAWSRGGDQIVTDGGIASEVVAQQFDPVAAVDAAGILAVWREGDFALRTGGITNDGELRPAQTIERSKMIATHDLANAGAYSLLVWSEGGEIRAVRIDAAGNVVVPFLMLGNGVYPRVASNGRDWVVTWEQLKHGTSDSQIVSAFVSQTMQTNGLQFYGAEGTSQLTATIAATPNGFLIGWDEIQCTPDGFQDRVVIEPLDAQGLRTTGGVRLVDRLVPYKQISPARMGIACRETGCLVTWEETGTGFAHRLSMIVGIDGRPKSEVEILTPLHWIARPAIVVAPNGGYRVYFGPMVSYAADDGTPRGTSRAINRSDSGSDAVLFNGRDAVVYTIRTIPATSSGSRVFLRVSARERAVRH